MTVKKKPSAKPQAAKPKPTPPVQECPAYHICREKKADCGICLELPPDKWKEHVKAVMARQEAA